MFRFRMDGGYLTIGRWRGVPLRVHLLTPLGALLFTGFRLDPGAWLGFLLLILLHEMGHAAWVMRYGRRVASIDLHAYGGVCRWSGEVTAFQRSVIAWGGVMAQVTVLGLTLCGVALFGRPSSVFLRELGIPGADTRVVLFRTDEGLKPGSTMNVVFWTDDVESTARDLEQKGVELTVKPQKEAWGTFAIFKDVDENKFVLGTK